MKSLTGSAQDTVYLFSFSIPLVGALPFFITQQKASFDPHVILALLLVLVLHLANGGLHHH